MYVWTSLSFSSNYRVLTCNHFLPVSREEFLYKAWQKMQGENNQQLTEEEVPLPTRARAKRNKPSRACVIM